MARVDRRAKIIETAIKVVEREGILAMTARHIAEKLNIQPSGVFYYFKDHRELMAGVVAHVMQVAEAKVSQSIAKAAKSATKTSLLEAYFRGTLIWAYENPVQVRILAAPIVLAQSADEISQHHQAMTARGIEKIYGYLAIGMAEGQFQTKHNLREAAEVLHSILVGASERQVYLPLANKARLTSYADSIWDVAIAYLNHSGDE